MCNDSLNIFCDLFSQFVRLLHNSHTKDDDVKFVIAFARIHTHSVDLMFHFSQCSKTTLHSIVLAHSHACTFIVYLCRFLCQALACVRVYCSVGFTQTQLVSFWCIHCVRTEHTYIHTTAIWRACFRQSHSFRNDYEFSTLAAE